MITQNNTKTIRELLLNVGEEFENCVFYRFEQDDTIFEKGYGTFSKDCFAVGGYIRSQAEKLGHDVHAALLGRSSYEYLTVLLGVPCAGGVAIPLDVQLSIERLAENLKKSDTDILFYDRTFSEEAELLTELCPFIKRFVCLQSRKNVRCVPMIHRVYRDTVFEDKLKPDKCAVIIFTSGTTGNSKGVMLSHGNLIHNMFCSDNEQETCLNVLPINHIFCISSDVMLVLRYGSTLCQCNDISKLLYYIQLFQPTAMRVVPMMIKFLCNRVAIIKQQNPDISISELKSKVFGKRLNKIVSGGGYLAPELAEKLDDFKISAGQGYGMSESSPKIAIPDYKRTDKRASVGRVVTGAELRIVDGEIQVKSPSVMLGYYKEPELTKETITEDGFLRTGDLGYVDEDDFLYLSGRKKNLIILSNGENVSPEMIEKLFDADTIVTDIIVYGEDDRIVAQVYPSYEYAQTCGITDIQAEIERIIAVHNKELPAYAQIAECIVRKVPFQKTTSNKVKRDSIEAERLTRETKKKSQRMPETELQQQIYDLVVKEIGDDTFGIDDNLFQCGLDSMSCTMLISDIAQELGKSISLSEVMDGGSIIAIEKAILDKEGKGDGRYEIREVYPLTSMMMYFAYVIPDNTTGNLPYALRMDKSVDLEKLKTAIYKVLDAHPTLKALCKPGENKYLAIFRDDSRVIDIPVIQADEAEIEDTIRGKVTPFKFFTGDDMVHIALYETQDYKYMFFDVAHFMGDGTTMNILMEDINKAYNGQEIEAETYTTFDYILEERERFENGRRQRDVEYVNSLLDGTKMSYSLLNKAEEEDLSAGRYCSVRKRFDSVARKEVVNYGKKHGVSENAYFVAAFNYCIHLFQGEDDVFSCSIHSGRTDSRWNRLAGPLFLTYFSRYNVIAHEKVEEMLKRTGSQIMETMKCLTSVPREGEMFFQFQGDLLANPTIGNSETTRVPLQLDSLPFHMQVMYDDKGYYTELRFWENRFEKEIIEVFLVCMESVLKAMLVETSARLLKRHMPNEVYPHHLYAEYGALSKAAGIDFLKGAPEDEMVRIYIFDEGYNKKPFGAWGPLYIMNYEPVNATETVQYPYGPGTLYGTGLVARINVDGTVDFRHKSGRKVLTDGAKGRVYYDLLKIEEILEQQPGIERASCYLKFDSEINEMSVAAEINAGADISIADIKEKLKEEHGERLVPKFIEVCG